MDYKSPSTRIEREVPEYARLYYQRLMPCMFVTLFGCMAVLLLANLADWPGRLIVGKGLLALILVPSVYSFALILIPQSVWIFVVLKWERRLLERLKAAEYKLCPKCGYPLRGLTGKTSCPECGAACDVENVEADWRAFRPKMINHFRRLSSLLKRLIPHP